MIHFLTISSLMMTATICGSLANAGTLLKFDKATIDPRAQKLRSLAFGSEEATDYVVQFHAAITQADHDLLAKHKVTVFRYVPDDALIVRAKLSTIEKMMTESPRINGFILYRGEIKLSENLPTLSVFSQGQREYISISAFTATDAQAILRGLQLLDPSLTVLDFTGRHLSLRLDQSLIAQIANITGVEFVQKMNRIESFHMDMQLDTKTDPEVDPVAIGDYSDLNGLETGTKIMNFDAAWALGYKGKGQVSSMADTGLDSGDTATIHPDFAGAVSKGIVFGVGAKSWNDPMGHGTHCSGSAVGRGIASGGKLAGGAPEANFVFEGMWSPIIENLTVPPKLAKLFLAAASEGAFVHSNSWGSPANLGAYDSMAQQVDDFMWNNPEFLAIFAAGNSGVDKDKDGVIDSGSMSTPGTAKNALTVGASENKVSSGGIQKQVKELKAAADNWSAEPIWSSRLSDDPNGIAIFSSRGPTKDGRTKPDVVAPGTNILSTRSQVVGASALWGAYNKEYAWSGGTSMSTPLTAGAATVARQILVEGFKLANPSAALVKGVLMHSAFDLFPGQYGQGSATQELKTHRPNSDQGYGRVDMAAVVGLKQTTSLYDEKAGVGSGESIEKVIRVQQGQNVKVTLVYTDAPGTPAAAKALVNDLDLELVLADGTTKSLKDRLNNHEYLEASDLKAGQLKVRVTGANVPMGHGGKQPFALLVSLL